MGRPTHLRLEMCPKCKGRFYDLTTGRCYACGFKGWGFIRPEEASKWSEEEAKRKKLILLGITLVLIILFLIFFILSLLL